MEKEMQALEKIANCIDEKESATKKAAQLLIKQAKEKAQQVIQKKTEESVRAEKKSEQKLLAEIAQQEQETAEQLAQEVAFYLKQYEENKEQARKKIVKELFGYVHCEDERISTDTA